MKKHTLAGLLSLAVIASALPASAAQDPEAMLKYTLTSEGSFKEDSRLIFMRDAVLTEGTESYNFATPMGETIVPEISNLEYLGSDMYEVQLPLEEDNVNKTGLYTSKGEELFPCEAASISLPTNRENGDARFLEVIYTTEQTDSEEEAIIYFTEDMFSFSAGEDDILYKGYAHVFDTQNKAFVEGVELDRSNRNGFYDLGESFAIEHDNITTMYDSEGNQVWETSGTIVGNTVDTLVVSSGGKYYIVDGEGKELFTSDSSISDAVESADIYKIYDAEGDTPYHLIDKEGNRLMEDTFGIVHDSAPNAFLVSKTGDYDEIIAISKDGSTISENAGYLSNVVGGYSYISVEDSENYIVVTPDNYYADLQQIDSSNLIFGKDDKCVVLNTGETPDIPAEEADGVAPGLAVIRQNSSSGTYYSLYDLFPGEELLPAEYARIEKAGEYILAAKEDSTGTRTWEAFHIELGEGMKGQSA